MSISPSIPALIFPPHFLSNKQEKKPRQYVVVLVYRPYIV